MNSTFGSEKYLRALKILILGAQMTTEMSALLRFASPLIKSEDSLYVLCFLVPQACLVFQRVLLIQFVLKGLVVHGFHFCHCFHHLLVHRVVRVLLGDLEVLPDQSLQLGLVVHKHPTYGHNKELINLQELKKK